MASFEAFCEENKTLVQGPSGLGLLQLGSRPDSSQGPSESRRQDTDCLYIRHEKSPAGEIEMKGLEKKSSRGHETGSSTLAGATGTGYYEDSRSETETEFPTAPENYLNLTEICSGPPVDNATENRPNDLESRQAHATANHDRSRQASLLTQASTICYLIWFSFLGVLAREGLASLTSFVHAPVIWTSLWPNFSGTLVLGFLADGAALFNHPALKRSISRPNPPLDPAVNLPRLAEGSEPSGDSQRAKVEKQAPQTPVPFHIGLAVGFCGSLTTFSGLMKDCFLALSNTLAYQGGAESSLSNRGAGEDLMAILSVLIVSLSVSVAGLKIGAHLAILVQTMPYRLPKAFMSWADRCVIPLAALAWVASICLAVLTPHHDWRGKMLFSLVFSPLGCLFRFYLSISLNAKKPAFPIGTYISNTFGTLVLAMVWDIQRSSVGGGNLPCQVQQGVMDGFCGCLTTISTFINELCALRRVHAYIYGSVTVVSGLVIVIVTMGVMKWTDGWSPPQCIIEW